MSIKSSTQLRAHVTSSRHRRLVPLRSPIHAPTDRHVELFTLIVQLVLSRRYELVPARHGLLSLLCVVCFHQFKEVPCLLCAEECACTQIRTQGRRIWLDRPHGLGQRSRVGQTKHVTRHLNQRAILLVNGRRHSKPTTGDLRYTDTW